MNKQELINVISEETDYTKASVEKMLNVFIDTLKDEIISGEEVRLQGFGTFKSRYQCERTYTDFQTNKQKKVKAKMVPSFNYHQSFKDEVSKKAKKRK